MTLTSNLQTLVTDLQAKAQAAADILALDSANTVLTADSTVKQQTIDALNAQIGTLNAQISTLQGQVSTLQGQLATTQATLATVQAQDTTDQQKISTLTGQISTLNAQIGTLNGQVTSYQAQVADLTGRLAAAQAALANAQATPPKTVTVRSISSLTEHNCSNSKNYNKATYPTLFTGITHHDTTLAPITIDPTLTDDSLNSAAPINISKVNLHTQMPAGWGGKIVNWLQAWWGTKSHPDIGYSNLNPVDVLAICMDSASRGFDVMCLDWYGIVTTGSGNDAIADLIIQNCPLTNQTFMLSIDRQYLTNNKYVAATYQQGLIDAINHLADRYFSNPAYEKSNGRPVLLLWDIIGLVGSNVNWNTVKASIRGNPLLIQYQANGFTTPATDGGFAWVSTGADSPSDPAGVSYLKNSIFPAMSSHQNLICISSVWPGFNGTLTHSVGWSDGKYIDRRNGQTWLDTWKANADYVNSGKRLDYIIAITWDDHQEGTALQAGILNDIVIPQPTIASGKLTWTVTGNQNTVQQYDVLMSADKSTVTTVGSIAPGNPLSFDLGTGSIPVGASLYVQAVGKPCIINRLSAPVPYIG